MITAAPTSHAQGAQLDFLSALFQPMVNVQAAASMLGCSVQHVVRMAEAGELVAFNVAVEVERGDEAVDERAKERMLRILLQSVLRLALPAARGKCAVPTVAQAMDSARMRDPWTRREIAHFLDCSDDHVRRLTEAKLLTGPLLTQTGSGRLQHISRASLGAFLTARDLSNL